MNYVIGALQKKLPGAPLLFNTALATIYMWTNAASARSPGKRSRPLLPLSWWSY